jgi:hypothetical protein
MNPETPENTPPKPLSNSFPNCFDPNRNLFLGSLINSKNTPPKPSIKLNIDQNGNKSSNFYDSLFAINFSSIEGII